MVLLLLRQLLKRQSMASIGNTIDYQLVERKSSHLCILLVQSITYLHTGLQEI